MPRAAQRGDRRGVVVDLAQDLVGVLARAPGPPPSNPPGVADSFGTTPGTLSALPSTRRMSRIISRAWYCASATMSRIV
jgi:hypothetical protein